VKRDGGRHWEDPALSEARRALELEKRRPTEDDRPPRGRKIRTSPLPGQLDIFGVLDDDPGRPAA
jgi:hypothetical protein